ncbi:conserved hypothetical protein [Ruegeria lacuscaerulensis ITI-1157]|nr:conserved hypothetical protein [Ruegeria lacuscaerulensis ITI-1157]SHK21285.1 hypothetical protein SAMN05444404_3478 [Ruegeria lacuscaerulensis ITI-1157]
MGAEDLSVRDFLNIFGDDEGLRGLRWKIAKCSKLRVELIEEALADFYGRLVDARKDKEKLGENTLTRHLADMLTACGIPAKREEDVNGHCDLVIRASGNFLWLGEAKVHSDYGWLDDGFQQLSTRYGTAMEGRDHGELIIYHRGGDSRNVLQTWKERLVAANDNVVVSEDIEDQRLYFRTEHKCANSGCTFYTRHHIVPLMHDPKK